MAQAVTGTLFGVAYPTDVVQTTTLGAYVFPGPVPWIVNKPQVRIVGIDTSLGQTTFAYQDVYTEMRLGLLDTVTESGTLTPLITHTTLPFETDWP